MIKHIVLWKFENTYSENEKQDILFTFKEKLEDLKGKIPELKSLTVYFNSKEAAAANFDIILETTFGTMDDLSKYQIHPEHIKVVEYVKSLKCQRACIDYEF